MKKQFSNFVFLLLLQACASTATPSAAHETLPAQTDSIVSSTDPVVLPSPEPSQTEDPVVVVAREHASAKKQESTDDIEESFEKNIGIWRALSDSDGIKTYQGINANTEIISFRGEAVLHAPIERLAAVLNTTELRKDWVDALADTHTIEKKSIFDRIDYLRSKVPWPFQDRDFVFRTQVRVKRSPYRIFVQMNSIEDPREPSHSGVVRGQILHAYYFLKNLSTPGNVATEVIVEIAADPKGSIPLWIVNLTQRSWPRNTLRALEKTSSREDLYISPEIKDFFSGGAPQYTKEV
jgi:hypothetical protein